jgi:hypothetical protein
MLVMTEYSCPLINASRQPLDPGEPLEPCRRNPQCEPHQPCRLAQHVAKLISQLSEPSSVPQALTALNNFLATEKLNINDVANLIEKRGYSADDMTTVFNLGKESARRDLEGQQHQLVGQQQIGLNDCLDTEGNPRWYEIALFCLDNVGRLHSDREKEFVADMPGKMLQYAAPTNAQAKWLLSIFVKLGGRIGPKIQARYFQR